MPKGRADAFASLDDTDWRTLDVLQRNARVSWSELGTLLGVSRPSAAERVRRLQQLGVVSGFTAVLRPPAIGLGILAFLGVVTEHPRYRDRFLALVTELPEVLECHHVTGEFDYLLKVRCVDTAALEELISHRLKGIRALVRTRTMIALSSVKDAAPLPLPGLPRPRARKGTRGASRG